ncbi:MAG: TetR/AcrR family transcriptional regulator [Myxococcaceae bacterium]|nr:TetR/AcrR family transcriptional regulator [Myxococcaceae bacterium]
MTNRSRHIKPPLRKKREAEPEVRRPGPIGGVRDTNRKEKAAAIKDAALHLFLERGIDAVSVDDIMKRAGMAKGGFYRYFETQTALVEDLIEGARRLMVEALEACSVDLRTASTRDAQFAAYRKVGDVVATLLMEHPGEVRLYLQECRAPAAGPRVPIVELSKVVSRYAISITAQAQAHRILKPIPVPVSALTVVGAAERLLLAVLQEEDIGNPLEVPEALTTLILDGLKA